MASVADMPQLQDAEEDLVDDGDLPADPVLCLENQIAEHHAHMSQLPDAEEDPVASGDLPTDQALRPSAGTGKDNSDSLSRPDCPCDQRTLKKETFSAIIIILIVIMCSIAGAIMVWAHNDVQYVPPQVVRSGRIASP